MHRMKTGALLRAAVLMGALSGHASMLTECTREALARYGDAIGLAFQVVDDLLDVEGSTDSSARRPARTRHRASRPTCRRWASMPRAPGQLRLRAQALDSIAPIGTARNAAA